MSGLEDGEITSDQEQPNELGDFNDEHLIDQLVERGNETARRSSSPNVCVTNFSNRKYRTPQTDHRAAGSYRRRSDSARRRQSNPLSTSTRSGPPPTSTWHVSGSRQPPPPRPPPLESIIFPPPPRKLNPDICRLQSLVSTSLRGNYYPAADNPPIFFPSPRLTHISSAVAPSTPPTTAFPKAVSPVESSFRGGNFDEVAMEESDDQNSPEVQPEATAPIQQKTFTLNHVDVLHPPPQPPPGILLAAQREFRDSGRSISVDKNESNNSTMSDEDPETLRQMLLSQMKQRKKRRTSRNCNNSPEKQSVVVKKSRTNSNSTVVVPLGQVESCRTPITTNTEPTHSVQAVVPTSTLAPSTLETALSVTGGEVAPNTELVVSAPTLIATSSSAVPLTENSSKEDLKQRLEVVDRICQDNRTTIDNLKQEYDGIVQRMQEIKNTMTVSRENIKSGVFEKRQIQDWIDKKEMEELDIIFDESEFVNFRTPVIKIEKTRESLPLQEPTVQTVLESAKVKIADAKKEPLLSAHESFQEPSHKAGDDDEIMSRKSVDSEDDSGAIASADNDSDDEREGDDEDAAELNLQSITPGESSDGDETETVVTGLSAEMSLREKLLAKCNLTRQSPESAVHIVSSSSERAENCRKLLLKMCKFGLNGTCGKGRDCLYLHLHQINDSIQQNQLLESIFRDVLSYNELDIEPAIDDVMKFLPQFREFEELMQKFLHVVLRQSPVYKNRFFELFVNGR